MAEVDLLSSSDENDEDFVPEVELSSDEGSSSVQSGDISDDDKGLKSRKRRKLSKKKSTSAEEKNVTEEEEKKGGKVLDIDALWAEFKEDVNRMEQRIMSQRQQRMQQIPKLNLESSSKKPEATITRKPEAEATITRKPEAEATITGKIEAEARSTSKIEAEARSTSKTEAEVRSTSKIEAEARSTMEIEAEARSTMETEAENKDEPGDGASGVKKRPLPFGMKRTPKMGLVKVLEHLAKKEKMSTLSKSKVDWFNFKKSQGIEEEIKKHNKGKEGYLEKQDFLQRTDLRQFEIEKQLRAAKRNQNQ